MLSNLRHAVKELLPTWVMGYRNVRAPWNGPWSHWLADQSETSLYVRLVALLGVDILLAPHQVLKGALATLVPRINVVDVAIIPRNCLTRVLADATVTLTDVLLAHLGGVGRHLSEVGLDDDAWGAKRHFARVEHHVVITDWQLDPRCPRDRIDVRIGIPVNLTIGTHLKLKVKGERGRVLPVLSTIHGGDGLLYGLSLQGLPVGIQAKYGLI